MAVFKDIQLKCVCVFCLLNCLRFNSELEAFCPPRWFVLTVVTAHKGLTDPSRLEPATPLLLALGIISLL